MNFRFDEYLFAKAFVENFNRGRSDNEPKAKMVAWPHDSIKRAGEWVVFAPKLNTK